MMVFRMSNHAHLITFVTEVWLQKPKCSFNVLKGLKGGARPHPQQLCLKDPNSQSSADWPPETYSYNPTETTQQAKMHTTS